MRALGAFILARLNWPIGFVKRSGLIGRLKASRSLLGFVLPALLISTSAAVAADGSATSNPDLLRGSYPSACINQWDCPPSQPSASPVGVSRQAPPVRDINCDLMTPGPAYDAICGVRATSASQPEAYQVSPRQTDPMATGSIAPPEPMRPLNLEPDWSIALRGTYTNDASGGRFGAALLPELSFSGRTQRGGYTISGSGEIVTEAGVGARIARGTLGATANHALGQSTTLDGAANFSLSSDSPTAPGATAGIRTQPLIITGGGELGVKRQFGRFGLELRGGLDRSVYGETIMQSGATIDNSERNRIGVEGSLRGSMSVTRSTSVFVEGGISRDIYDVASTGLGVRLNSWTYAVRAGVSASWRDVLEAEISAGYGLRRFDSATLTATPGWLAAASLTYRPQERLSLTGSLSTEFAAPETGSGAAVEVDYIASLAAQYRVNRRLNLRASLGGQWSDFAGVTPSGWSFSAGGGADFSINKQTSLTADYVYETGQSSGAAREDSHQISLGVRYGR